MLNPPNQMQTQTESLSAMIRFPNEKNILCRYSEFIRDNVLSVVNATFPLFYAQFSRQKLDGMVDGFVTKHGALLEYEWVTFCVEIDSISGNMSYFTPKEVVEDDCLQVNPTLKLTQVPFLLHQDSVTFLTSDSHFVFYGVFRNQDHHVVSQRLRDVDVALIQMLIDQPDLTSAQLQQTVNQNDVSFSVIEWVQHFGELGLLKVQFIGE